MTKTEFVFWFAGALTGAGVTLGVLFGTGVIK